MMLWNELKFLHETLPYPLLKLWGSSEKLAYLTQHIAYGKKKYEQWSKLLNKMQEWDVDKIYEFQFERLKKNLVHAYKNVPHYKIAFDNEGLKPSDIKCLEDMQKIPVITKEDILKEYNKFFAKNRWYKRKIYRPTSGSSGSVLRVCQDEDVIAASCATVNQFLKNFLGYSLGRDVVLYSIPSAGRLNTFFKRRKIFFPTKDKMHFYSPVVKGVIFPHRNCGEDTFKEYISVIKKFNINLAVGYPSTFFAFTKYIEAKNIKVEIKTVLLFGEILYKFQRKHIEESLSCKVFNEYGQIEATIVACECSKHNGMHISPILGIAEVLNQGLRGKGELVMTNLVNYSWPLIRYNIKDTVVLSKKKCTCGCSFPRLMDVKGRNNDFIILPDGSILHPMPLARLIKFIPGIQDLYFLQNKDYSLDILVVKEEKSETSKIKNILEQKVKSLSKNKLKVQVIFKKYIERRNNKYKVVETKVSHL